MTGYKYGYKSRWANGKNNSEHKVVYEQNFGPVPVGFHVHHRDENSWNNDPSNLEVLPGLEHRRIHAPNYQRNEAGEWMKFCRACGEIKPLDAFHVKTTLKGTQSTRPICKPCRIAEKKEWVQNRRKDPAFVDRERAYWRVAATKIRNKRKETQCCTNFS